MLRIGAINKIRKAAHDAAAPTPWAAGEEMKQKEYIT